jgi:predicted MFS family arabinose efflux permease
MELPLAHSTSSLSDVDHAAAHQMTADTRTHPADRLTVIMAALAAAAIGALMYNVLPLYLGAMAEGHNLGEAQTGLVGTAFFFGFNLAGLSAVLWIRRLQWRVVSLAVIPIILGCLAASIWIGEFAALATFIVMCGVASGIIYTIGSVIIGDTARPERWYGAKVALESLAGTFLLFLLPATWGKWYGLSGTVAGMGMMIVLLLPLLIFLPPTWDKRQLAPAPSHSPDTGPVAAAAKVDAAAISCAILALLSLCAGASAIWAFAERIGRLSGFDPESVGGLLGITLLSGILGSLGVALLGNRIRPVRFYVSSSLLIVMALFCLSIPGSFLLYGFGNCLYMIGWSAATPLASAIIARLDHDGRYASLLVPAIGFGSMIGPGVAGLLLETYSTTAVLIYASGTIILAALFMLVAARRGSASLRT